MKKTLFVLAYALAVIVKPSQACTVSVPSISFGSYDTVNPVSVVQSLTVTCGKGSEKGVVSYSAGSGSYASRVLTSGSSGDTLQYNLYGDAAHTQLLGDGSSGTVTQSFQTLGHSPSTSIPIYAHLPGGQNVAPGLYTSAVITVTVTY